QELLESSLRTPLRAPPRITLEELDGDEVIVRIVATPRDAADGRQLATEVLSIVSGDARSEAERSEPARSAAEASRRQRRNSCDSLSRASRSSSSSGSGKW